MVGREWTSVGKGFDHNGFFPLTGAHKTAECTSCHNNNYSKTETYNDILLSSISQCKDCHNPGSAKTSYPAHTSLYLKFDCRDCHSTLNWTGLGKFGQHDSWGKIYSGKHKGRWNSCTDCHNNDATYKANCRKCHNFDSSKRSMD